jgi:hypothetical protein
MNLHPIYKLLPFALALAAAARAEPLGIPVELKAAHDVTRRIALLLPESPQGSDITAVESEAKSKYVPATNGAWLFQSGAPAPAEDVLTLTLKTRKGGSFLLIHFPTNSTLPANGPGLAENGNAVIGEIEIESGGKPVKASVYSSRSQSNGGRVAGTAFDGVKQKGDAGWDSEASGWELGMGKPAQLVARLEQAIPAGGTVTVRLIAKSRWGRHVPGIVSASIVGGADLPREIATLDGLKSAFDRWKVEVPASLDSFLDQPDAATAVTADPGRLQLLAQCELLRSCGDENVWAVLTRKEGHAFLSAFLADRAWMESFLLGGAEGTGHADFAQALENLRLLHSQYAPRLSAEPLYKRLATAIALQAGTMNRYRMVERFDLIEKAHHAGLLHGAFDRLDVRAMRHAINLGGTAFDFQHSLNDIQFTAGGYVGACWAVPYTDPSTYGYSIQGWGFHDPLRHAYPVNKIFREIGGVCGTLSGFGANAALTHGVPAFTVGQPAHCAYVVRTGDHWATGNDVSGPPTNSWSAYEGLNFTATDALLEPTENSPLYPAASRAAWVARLQQSHALPPVSWQASFEKCLEIQPLNYARWMEYFKALKTEGQSTEPAAWLALGDRAAQAFKAHQEAAWSLVQFCLANGQNAVPTPRERVTRLLAIHHILSQKAVPSMYGYPLGNYLHWQADWIADPSAVMDFFGGLLTEHWSEKPELNWVFGGVMGWGSARFADKPATATAYANAMAAFFTGTGGKCDKGQIAGIVSAGLQKASESGDLAAWQTWLQFAGTALPAVGPGDVFLTPAQVAQRPKVEPFSGALLSGTALLQLSSHVGFDRPLSYPHVLSGGGLGFFDTNPEPKPWAKLTLAGDAELSGIVLVDRYEFPSEQPWDVPMKVEISTDNKTWTEVALIEKVEAVYRIDLQGRNLRARYIRLERQPSADPAQPSNGRFHLRNFLVYGRKLS